MLVAAAIVVGCAGSPEPPPSKNVSTTAGAPSVAASTSTSSSASAAVAPSASASTSASVVASVSASASVAPPPPPPPLVGQNFAEQARTLYRVAACGKGEIPARFDAAVVDEHCKEMKTAYGKYKSSWLDPARKTITALVPQSIPKTVVYPFGGGDLVSALAVFADATEITTLSLEPSGDIRGVDALDTKKLEAALKKPRADLVRLYSVGFNRTTELEKEAKGALPGEILYALSALAVHDFEPISLRYFVVEKDGKLHYLEEDEIKKRTVTGPSPFRDVEIQFRAVGDDSAPLRVFRHFSRNLDDVHFTLDKPLRLHLSAKGLVSAMTKAAHYLLWSDAFSGIRGYLVDHLAWMISDSTGIPPRVAKEAGLVQEAIGGFEAPGKYGTIDVKDTKDMRALFATATIKKLDFSFGYGDTKGEWGIVVTRRPSP